MNLNERELQEYENFVQKHYRAHIMQSVTWANVKYDWINEIIVIKNKKGKIKGGMSVLIRKMPILNKTMMYAPRGPICDIDDKETLIEIVKQAKILAKKHKCFVLKMDPDIDYKDEEFEKIVKRIGFKIQNRKKDFSGVQPRFVFRLDTSNKSEDEIFNSFHSKTRYNIRLAQKKGVTVRVGTYEDIPLFYDVMKVTGSRDGFVPRSLEYFQIMYKALGKYNRLYIVEYEGKVIAGALTILYGDKVWYLYGASSNEYRNVMPNHLMQWEMIKWGIENSCNVYDFRGCADGSDRSVPIDGLCRFKMSFNAKLVEFVGELNYPINPVTYFVVDKAMKLQSSYRKIKRKKRERNNDKVNKNESENKPKWDDYRE